MSLKQKKWADYARAQEELKDSTVLNDRNRGLECALDKILDGVENGIEFNRLDVERYIQSGARQNRYRTSLLQRQLSHFQLKNNDPRQSYEIRFELEFLRRTLGDENFNLLQRVAEGHEYRVLAEHEKLEPSSLRKRVSRLRFKARELVSNE